MASGGDVHDDTESADHFPGGLPWGHERRSHNEGVHPRRVGDGDWRHDPPGADEDTGLAARPGSRSVGEGWRDDAAIDRFDPQAATGEVVTPRRFSGDTANLLHIGPLPDPRTLERYGEIHHTYPERIFRMAEGALETQNRVEERASRAEAAAVWTGITLVAITVPLSYTIVLVALVMRLPLASIILAIIPAALATVVNLVKAVKR